MAASILLLLVLAADRPSTTPPGEWGGSGQLGLLLARGNSEATTLNAKLLLRRKGPTWQHEASLSALRSRRDGKDSADREELALKSDFRREAPRYGFAALRLERDEFAAYRWQATFAAGLGWKLIDQPGRSLELEGGPGWRRARTRDPALPGGGAREADLILRAALRWRQALAANAELFDQALLEGGPDNRFLQNAFGLHLRIHDRLGLKATAELRHNTTAPPGRRRTDTVVTLDLAYDF